MTGSEDLADHALREARRAVLGTIGADGRPHLVPIVFAAVAARQLVTAIDHKPKGTRRLQRLRNVERDPRITLLVDHYSEEWSQLWWVRVDGTARIWTEAPPGGQEALTAKYPVYRTEPPQGPWLVIEASNIVTWTA